MGNPKIINFKNLQASVPNRYKMEVENGGTSYALLTRESEGETQAPTPLNQKNLRALQNNCSFNVNATRKLEANNEFYDIVIEDSDTYDLIDYNLVVIFNETNTTQSPRIRLNGNSYPLISTEITSMIVNNIQAKKPYVCKIVESLKACYIDIDVSDKTILGYDKKYNLTGGGQTLQVTNETICFDKNGVMYNYIGTNSTWVDNLNGNVDSNWEKFSNKELLNKIESLSEINRFPSVLYNNGQPISTGAVSDVIENINKYKYLILRICKFSDSSKQNEMIFEINANIKSYDFFFEGINLSKLNQNKQIIYTLDSDATYKLIEVTLTDKLI